MEYNEGKTVAGPPFIDSLCKMSGLKHSNKKLNFQKSKKTTNKKKLQHILLFELDCPILCIKLGKKNGTKFCKSRQKTVKIKSYYNI